MEQCRYNAVLTAVSEEERAHTDLGVLRLFHATVGVLLKEVFHQQLGFYLKMFFFFLHIDSFIQFCPGLLFINDSLTASIGIFTASINENVL